MTLPLTPEQLTTARLLVEEHHDLQSQLLDLNHDLDDHLSRRGQGLSRVQPLSRGNPLCDKMAIKNEKQRKTNDELARQILVVDALAKTDDLKQRLSMLTIQAETLRDENKSLENIYANQQAQTNLSEKIDQEMRRAKQEHNEEIAKLKETVRQLKDARESEAEQVRNLLKAENRLEMRIKLQADATASNMSIPELEMTLAAKDSETQTLREQILALSKVSQSRTKARHMSDKRSKEFDELRSEADLLREKLEAMQIIDEL